MRPTSRRQRRALYELEQAHQIAYEAATARARLKRMILKSIGMICLLAALFTYFWHQDNYKPEYAQHYNSRATEVSTNVDQLLSAYRANALRADKRYKGKVIDLAGRVESMTLVGQGPTVVLRAESGEGIVTCNFDRDNQYGLESLRIGDKALVHGFLVDGGAGAASVQGCILRSRWAN